MARLKMDCGKPRLQIELRAVHYGSGGHRCLSRTGRAFPGERLAPQFPALATIAAGTNKPFRPALFRQIPGTRCLIRKPTLELGSRHRPVVFPPISRENKIGTFATAVKPCRPQALDAPETTGEAFYLVKSIGSGGATRTPDTRIMM